MTMRLLTGPTLQIIATADARVSARIDDTRFDADIPRWLAIARAMAEQYCGQFFAEQTWREDLDDFPAADDGFKVPFASSVEITYWNGSAWASLSTPAQFLWVSDQCTCVAPVLGTSWPSLPTVAVGPRVRIDMTAGAASIGAVPDAVKEFAIAHVALWADENRAASPQDLKVVPWLLAGLDPLRVW